jgi:DNA-binding beta-propeller fold protein YncE
VATANVGYAITGYGVSPDGTRIALWETACTPQQGQPQGLLVAKVLGTQMSHTVAFPSFPPMVVGDPVWDPDGQHVVAVVRTGNMATVDRIDAFAARDENDVQPACGRTAWSDYGLPTAVAVDANGAFWVAAESSGGAAVIRCSGTGAQRMFTAAAGGGPVDVAVSSDGRAVLVTDGAGAVWRWAGGSVVKLTPQPAQPQVSW